MRSLAIRGGGLLRHLSGDSGWVVALVIVLIVVVLLLRINRMRRRGRGQRWW